MSVAPFEYALSVVCRSDGRFRTRHHSCTVWYMITDSGVDIDAPATVVWDVFSDVERWPEWTDSVTSLVALDGPGHCGGQAIRDQAAAHAEARMGGHRCEPGRSWTWVQRSPGGLTKASHDIEALSDRRTRVRQQIDQGGPVGALVGLLMRRMTRRYLELEAAGLKGRSERLHHLDGPAS